MTKASDLACDKKQGLPFYRRSDKSNLGKITAICYPDPGGVESLADECIVIEQKTVAEYARASAKSSHAWHVDATTPEQRRMLLKHWNTIKSAINMGIVDSFCYREFNPSTGYSHVKPLAYKANLFEPRESLGDLVLKFQRHNWKPMAHVLEAVRIPKPEFGMVRVEEDVFDYLMMNVSRYWRNEKMLGTIVQKLMYYGENKAETRIVQARIAYLCHAHEKARLLVQESMNAPVPMLGRSWRELAKKVFKRCP